MTSLYFILYIKIHKRNKRITQNFLHQITHQLHLKAGCGNLIHWWEAENRQITWNATNIVCIVIIIHLAVLQLSWVLSRYAHVCMNSGWFSCCKKCILVGLWNHFICRFQCFAYLCYMVAMPRLNGKSIVSGLIIIINSVLLLIQLWSSLYGNKVYRSH